MNCWFRVASWTMLMAALAMATPLQAAGPARGGRPGSSLARRVGALLKKGDCPKAVDLALAAGDLDLARKTRAYCAVAAGAAPSGAAFATPLADPDGPDPPKSLSADDVDQWISQNVRAPGWEQVDRDQDGVHLATATDAALSADKTLMVWAREELFQPAVRSGVVARSDRQRFEIDCAGKRFRLLSMQVFGRNNLTGDSRDVPGPITDWAAAKPGSREGQQIQHICAIGAQGVGATLSNKNASPAPSDPDGRVGFSLTAPAPNPTAKSP